LIEDKPIARAVYSVGLVLRWIGAIAFSFAAVYWIAFFLILWVAPWPGEFLAIMLAMLAIGFTLLWIGSWMTGKSINRFDGFRRPSQGRQIIELWKSQRDDPMR